MQLLFTKILIIYHFKKQNVVDISFFNSHQMSICLIIHFGIYFIFINTALNEVKTTGKC